MINTHIEKMNTVSSFHAPITGGLTRIVTRLRIAFLLGVMVVAAASVAGVFQARAISRAHSNLVDIDIPVFAQTHETIRILDDVFAAVELATVAPDQPTLDQIRDDYRAALEALNTSLQEARAFTDSQDVLQSVTAATQALQSAIAPLFDMKAQLFQSDDRIQAMMRDLVDLHSRAGLTLETLNFQTTGRIETVLMNSRDGHAPTPEVIQQLFSNLFLRSLNLTNIALDLETIIDLTFGFQLSETSEVPASSRAILENKMRRVVAVMAQIETGPERTTLAQLVQQMDHLLFTSDGLLARLADRERILADLETIRSARQQIADNFTALNDRINTEALAQVDLASGRLGSATLRLMGVLGAAALGTLALAALANLLITERQINHRMDSLHRAVSAIAGGTLDHPIEVTGKDELGDIARALAVFRQTALALDRSNVDLENFAYVAAHDLRSPLRAIHDLAAWSLEDPENSLSETTQKYLALLLTRTERLDNLLTDLLDYARAGQKSGDEGRVDLSEMVHQISSLLDQSGAFHVHYDGPNMTVITHPTPLKQILMNLVSNAIKHHDKPQGEVVVKVTHRAGRLRFAVHDDGPGIPKQYQDRIFALFQTLRPRDEVEGSGLGLAIIRKLVNRYDGRIRVSSDPGSRRGTTFIFDFPGDAPRFEPTT